MYDYFMIWGHYCQIVKNFDNGLTTKNVMPENEVE